MYSKNTLQSFDNVVMDCNSNSGNIHTKVHATTVPRVIVRTATTRRLFVR
jgi:hypothetical protein